VPILQLTDAYPLPALPSHRRPFLTMWTRPRETVRWIVAENPDLYLKSLACLCGIGDLLSRDFANNTAERPPAAIVAAVLEACLYGPLWGLLWLWLASHLVTWTGRWIGGKATREHLKAALAWASVPLVCGVPLWVPLVAYSYVFAEDAPNETTQSALLVVGLLTTFLVEAALAVWAAVLLCQTVAEVQGFRSGWRALANIVMAMSVFVTLITVLAILFFMTFG
jgi:Yip1 domain